MHQPLRLASLTSALCCLLPPASAQGDFDLDKSAAGTLGGALTLQVRNAPANKLLLMMMSTSAGPTPFSLFDPADPRAAEVGLELAHGWLFLFTSPTGTASVSFGLPPSPGLNGFPLHWQSLTLPGTTFFVDQVSNRVATMLGLPATPNLLPGTLTAARAATTGFFDRNRNAGQGDYVMAGGGATTEIWDFRTLSGRVGPAMVVPRATHTATVLTDGRVLIAGGVDGTGVVQTACEIYDPATGTFTATGSLLGARALHAATRLADGRVMVAGGTNNVTDITAIIAGVLNSVEIYNPATGTWSAAPNLGGRRVWPALTLLTAGPNSGRVMVSGGVEVTFFLGIPLAATSTNKTQFYNPATNSWSTGANMLSGRAVHDINQVTLNDGRVLMTGGVLVPDLLNAINSAAIAAAEVYNPVTNSWTAANMADARFLHTATRLADGRVVVCGGSQGLLSAPVAIDGVAIFDPASNSWSNAAAMTTPRTGHAAALLPDGMLVILGGADNVGGLATAESLHF